MDSPLVLYDEAWSRVEAIAKDAGVSTDDVLLMLRILRENGGSMNRADLEREWSRRRGETGLDDRA